MIKLICEKCGSDDIFDVGESSDSSVFRCDNCDYEFKIEISEDMWEFDTK